MTTEYGEQERAARLIERESGLANGAQQPIVVNNTPVQNVIHGPGTINNFSANITYIGDAHPLHGLDLIQAKIDKVLNARYVCEAPYDAQRNSGCMDGTRVQVLSEIKFWINDPDSPPIFWLTGMAGSGKTTIASTVSSQASEDPALILGGSFFCSRSCGSQAQRDVHCIIPTLARLLARQSPSFGYALADELDRDPEVLHKQVGVQVKKLLYNPLLALKGHLEPVVFVIDALDECGGELTNNGTLCDPESYRTVTDMLEALVSFSRSSSKLPVKFFVTSRPEAHIRDTPVSNSAFSKVLQLHTVDRDQVAADVWVYIATRLTGTRQLRSRFTDEDIDMLARLSNGLFIIAATALQYAFSAGIDIAVERFRRLLNDTGNGLSNRAIAPLDRMYAIILASAARADEAEVGERAAMLKLLASILSARMALSVTALADLSDTSPDGVRATLSHLHAILHIPVSDVEPGIRTIHASFEDYLLDRAERDYRIQRSLGDETLAWGCLHVMAKLLHFNVSGCRTSYLPNPPHWPGLIRLSLEYACLHWIYHISRLYEVSRPGENSTGGFRPRLLPLIPSIPVTAELDDTINRTFRPVFLFWLEAMSILGQIRRATAMLVFASVTVTSEELACFFRDANSFVASSQEAIERSAPHIYVSALPFAAKESLVYKDFFPHCTGLLVAETFGTDHHAGCLVMTLTGHENAVTDVAYSSDGHLLASSSRDGTVRIWDMRTCEEMISALRVDGCHMLSVGFSPYGTSVAAGTAQGLVCLWNIVAGQVTLKRLLGHTGAVKSVKFSSNGSLLATASDDTTVRLWCTDTGQLRTKLDGHTRAVNSVAFAPFGTVVVSGSDDGTIRFWNAETGDYLQHSTPVRDGQIRSISFAADGNKIVAGTEKAVLLCNLYSGKWVATLDTSPVAIQSVTVSPNGLSVAAAFDTSVRISTIPQLGSGSVSVVLGGHADEVHSVSFSPDGLYVASVSADCTIRIWNSGSHRPAIEPPRWKESSVNSVALSSDGEHIVSGCDDGSIHVWNALTGAEKLPKLLGHTKAVYAVAVSSNGHLIASASADTTVRLWDVRTVKAVHKPLRDHENEVRAVAFSSDMQYVISASSDRTARIWNVADGIQLMLLHPSVSGPIRPVLIHREADLRFSRDVESIQHIVLLPGDARLDGRRTSEAAEIWRFDVPNQTIGVLLLFFADRELYRSSHHPLPARMVGDRSSSSDRRHLQRSAPSTADSSDGRIVASGLYDRDCAIRLQSAEKSELISTLRGHNGIVTSVAFAADGQSIVSGSADSTIRSWMVSETPLVPSPSDGDPVSALTTAILDDGWLKGPSGELLLWVPAAYRQYLVLRPCTLRIAARGMTLSIGDSGWSRGENWTSCWRQNAGNIGSRIR